MTTTPAAQTQWFHVAQDKLRRSRAGAAVGGGLVVAFDGFLIFVAVATDGKPLWTWLVVAATLAGLLVLVMFLVSRSLIRSANQSLGVEARGLWWHESGQSGFIPWDSVRVVQIGIERNHRGYPIGSTLDVHTHQPIPAGNPVIDQLANAGRYRIELTRPPFAIIVPVPLPRNPAYIAAAIQYIRPDKWIPSA